MYTKKQVIIERKKKERFQLKMKDEILNAFKIKVIIGKQNVKWVPFLN
jgi:hypothetical protein